MALAAVRGGPTWPTGCMSFTLTLKALLEIGLGIFVPPALLLITVPILAIKCLASSRLMSVWVCPTCVKITTLVSGGGRMGWVRPTSAILGRLNTSETLAVKPSLTMTVASYQLRAIGLTRPFLPVGLTKTSIRSGVKTGVTWYQCRGKTIPAAAAQIFPLLLLPITKVPAICLFRTTATWVILPTVFLVTPVKMETI